jgi:hypothetical protein
LTPNRNENGPIPPKVPNRRNKDEKEEENKPTHSTEYLKNLNQDEIPAPKAEPKVQNSYKKKSGKSGFGKNEIITVYERNPNDIVTLRLKYTGKVRSRGGLKKAL